MGLREQAAALTFMHAANVIQPILIIPYAANVLEPTRFGEFVYAIAIGQIASTLVDYGFHWTAQRAAAAARNDAAALASLYANVISTKVLIFAVVMSIGLLTCQPLLAMSRTLFVCAMLMPLGNALFPSWLFIGTEQAWRAAMSAMAARVVLLVIFIVAVRSSSDVALATALQAAVPLLAAAISVPLISVGFSGFKALSLNSIGSNFKHGWRAFLFAAVERTVITLPVPMVSHLVGYAAAGQYAVADKFVSATRPFFHIITETFLPRIAFYAKHRPDDGLILVWNVFYTLIVGASLSASLYFIAPYVIHILFGDGFAPAIPIVRIMAIVPLLINLNTLTSNLYMFNFGHERAWSSLIVVGLIVFFVVAWALTRLGVPATLAVALAVISKEFTVFLVSAGYFVTFAVRRPVPHESTPSASGPSMGSGATRPI